MADEQQEDPIEAAENMAAANGNAAFAERLRHQAAQIRSARAEAAKLRAELDGVSKSHVPMTELEKLRSQIEVERASWPAERAVYSIGITDPQAIKVAQLFHADLPEAERPPLADWLKGLHAEPSKAPKALQLYFGAPASTDQPQGNQRRAAAAPPVAASVATTTTGATSGELSAEQIRQIQQRARESGDWAEWDRYFPRK